MTFVRTVLGDIHPSELGVCYAHEHLVIDGGYPVVRFPDFLLADVGRMSVEVAEAQRAGLRAAVDAMPLGAGRNALKLAELARRTGLHIIAPTGLHLTSFYAPDHPSQEATVDELVRAFQADVEEGIPVDDAAALGSVGERTRHRAGVIKVAAGRDGPTGREERAFVAAAEVHRATRVPILTHCDDGRGGLAQVRLLGGLGVDLAHVTLSHTDKAVDRGYHRELLASGVNVEYDQGFRWKGSEPNGTLQLLEWMLEDGFGDRVMLGSDAARQGYLHAYGGEPGLAFLLTTFAGWMAARGIGEAERERMFVTNPARAFAFVAAAA